MLGIIVAILLMIVMFKVTLFLLKLLGKVLGALLSVIGYLFLGGLIVTLSIPLIFITLLVLSGIVSIIIGFIKV